MSEKIQRYALLELFTAKWGQCDVEWCKASDIGPLEARIETLEKEKFYWNCSTHGESEAAWVCPGCLMEQRAKLTEQAEEIERLKLEIERVANLGINAVIKALDKTP